MKWIITIPAILLFALAGCGKDKQSTNELITVDVTVSYPKKELILQDRKGYYSCQKPNQRWRYLYL